MKLARSVLRVTYKNVPISEVETASKQCICFSKGELIY